MARYIIETRQFQSGDWMGEGTENGQVTGSIRGVGFAKKADALAMANAACWPCHMKRVIDMVTGKIVETFGDEQAFEAEATRIAQELLKADAFKRAIAGDMERKAEAADPDFKRLEDVVTAVCASTKARAKVIAERVAALQKRKYRPDCGLYVVYRSVTPGSLVYEYLEKIEGADKYRFTPMIEKALVCASGYASNLETRHGFYNSPIAAMFEQELRMLSTELEKCNK